MRPHALLLKLYINATRTQALLATVINSAVKVAN
jgi:hypothetical protein